ncbi:MAG: hypothetical protein LBS30_05950 [Planctomycetota bacterium]|jgi:hypothetical protein|nr:hypothetical protein [Planctomycetota bacterium]
MDDDALIRVLTAMVRDHYVGVLDQCKTRLDVNRLTRLLNLLLVRMGANPDEITPGAKELDAERIVLSRKLEEMEQVLAKHDHADAYREISNLLDQILEQRGRDGESSAPEEPE